METTPIDSGDKKEGNFSADYIRHSKASYKTYGQIASSPEPKGPFNPNEQILPDITEAGIELAKKEAEKYFANLNPQENQLFFVSSNEARTIETANVYRQIAKEKGFEIIKPDNARSEISEELAEGDIRIINTISINSKNVIVEGVFNPPAFRGSPNLDALTAEEREQYDRAAAIVDNDNQGSWGANFAKHGAAIKEIIPEILAPEDQYNTKFKDLLRLIKFGQEKAAQVGGEKKIKVLAFGHENMMAHVLQVYFQENGLNNCEAIGFEPVGDKLEMSYRGNTAEI